MASLPVRCALLVLALAVVAWMGLSIRSLDLDAQGRAVLASVQDRKISAADLERARSAFHRAHRFNADRTPLLDEAFLLQTVKRGREALALGERLVADEPDNRDAWTLVYLAAGDIGDRATTARAARAIEVLDPQNAERILRRGGSGD